MVSIHNHPEGRLQPPVGWLLAFRDFLFQSTTTPKDGCNPLPADGVPGHLFQSTTTPKDGCNSPLAVGSKLYSAVSIHNHPEGRLQQRYARRCGRIVLVSIHNHPEGRLQRRYGYCPHQRERVSIHNHPEGRLQHQRHQRRDAQVGVSIHNHPEGRLQRPYSPPGGGRGVSFQSTTTPKDGCNLPRARLVQAALRFQSTTTPKDGCNQAAWDEEATDEEFQSTTTPKDGCNLGRCVGRARKCFNPQPPRRTAATVDRISQVQAEVEVSIHSHPEGRLQPLKPQTGTTKQFRERIPRKGRGGQDFVMFSVGRHGVTSSVSNGFDDREPPSNFALAPGSRRPFTTPADP